MTVLVVGNAAIDTSFEVSRLPRPGESILAVGMKESLGGKGLNQAVAAARAGVRTGLCAPIGSDWAAEVIERCLRDEGVDATGLVRNPGASDRSTVCVISGGENAIVTSAAQAQSLAAADAREAITALGNEDVVLMQGNLSKDTTLACAEQANGRVALLVINPSPITFDFAPTWPLTDIVVLNEAECMALSGRSDPGSGARRLLSSGVGTVVVTRGARGALVVDPGSSVEIPSPQVRAVDTTGAGDLFCGVLAAAVATGLDVIAACRWAVAGAAVAVTRRGAVAAFPTAAELASVRPS
jgi:ribokinase